MLRKTIETFGGPYINNGVVKNPRSQIDQSYINDFLEATAQMTNTSPKAVVTFKTTTTSGPVSVSVVDCYTQWGNGSSFYPTVVKAATGEYGLTFSSSYVDSNESVETTAFVSAQGTVSTQATYPGICQTNCSSYVTNCYVYSLSSAAKSDLGGAVEVHVVIY